MATTSAETELVRKLLHTGHINVPERRALPGGRARASLIVSAIEEGLQSGHPLRAWWMPDDSMIGCQIEYRGIAPGRVDWRYSGIEGKLTSSREYPSMREAAEAIAREARTLLGDHIDGVPIDWDA